MRRHRTLLGLCASDLCGSWAPAGRGTPAAHVEKASEYTAAGDYDAATMEYTKAIEKDPGWPGGYRNRAHHYQYIRRYDLALEDYRKAIALDPEETDSDYVDLLVFMRREQEAAEYAERLVRSHPDSALLNCILAMALERSKNYPRAYEAVNRCIGPAETGANSMERLFIPMERFPQYYRLQARLAARVGRKDEAWRSIDKVTAIDNGLYTRYSRASIYYIEGVWEQALQTLLDAYAQAKGGEKDSLVGIESRFLLGQCYQQLGKWREAREAYEEFVAANPYEKEAFANLGLVKAKLGDSDAALADFSKALDIDPKFLDARRTRGTVYLGQKRYDSAIEDFSAVLAEDGDDMGTLHKRAYAYCTSGQGKLGAKDLREVLRVDPKNDDAKALLPECA